MSKGMNSGLLKTLLLMLSLVVLIASCATTSHGQKVIGLDLLDSDGEATVPFEIEQGFIIVKVWLNGIIPLRMIFDTGAENTILFDKEIAQILGIEFERQIPIIGSDLDSILIANIARNVNTRLEGCNTVSRDLIVLQENTLFLKEKLGTEISGIVGGSYFSNLVVKIDYRKERITFTHPSQFDPPTKGYKEFDIDIVSSKPYVEGNVQISGEETKKLTLLLDSGAALPFLIHTNTDSTLSLPDRVMVGNVGYGLSGAIYGYRGKSRRFELGPLFFNEIVTSFQDLLFEEVNENVNLIRNGIVGNTLLARFTVIIDYTREKLFLKPKRKYNKGFDFDKSGITLFAVGPNLDQYYVVAVIEDSPADIAGIQPGDLIIKLGARKTKRMSLDKINRKLSKKEGKMIKMTVKRGDEVIKTSFRLKEWFDEQNN